MLLDDGILTIYVENNIALSGNQPKYELKKIDQVWYKSYSVGIKENAVHKQNNTEYSGKARIWRNESVDNHSIIKLANGKYYSVVNVYHGTDDNKDLVTDITLGLVIPKYENQSI